MNDNNEGSVLVYTIDYEKFMLERAKQGKSIRELAEQAQLDIKTVIRIEKQKVVPRPQTVGKIAKALGKDLEYFLQPLNNKVGGEEHEPKGNKDKE